MSHNKEAHYDPRKSAVHTKHHTTSGRDNGGVVTKMETTYMKEEVAPDDPLEVPSAQISRRESLRLSAASIVAWLLPVSALAAREPNHHRLKLKRRTP